jgi:Skp family chaperone for outer membrane proteins
MFYLIDILDKIGLYKSADNLELKIIAHNNYQLNKKQNSLKKASLDSMSKVNDKIKDIIAEIAKEKEFDVIVPASQTLYYKDGLDVSDEVLKKLNKKITKVDVKFE